ncbi:MAG TPA: hypothetical protein VJH71_01115 [Candidatus Paceibacterota bacterium]
MYDEQLRIVLSQKIRGLLLGDYISLQLSAHGSDLEEKRKFRLGDDPHSIDPLVTFKNVDRIPRVVIKRMEKAANIIFLIDCSPSTRFHALGTEKYYYSLSFVENITLACQGRGNRFRFISCDQKVRLDSGFVTSAQSVEEVLSELHSIKSIDVTQTNLNHAFKKIRDEDLTLKPDASSIIFVLSDFLFEPNFIPELTKLTEFSDSMLVQILDPIEMNLPKIKLGFLKLRDMESGKTFIAKGSSNPLDTVLASLKRYQIDLLTISSKDTMRENLEKLIIKFEEKEA